MDPNNQNPQGDSEAVKKLENDLDELTQKAKAEQTLPTEPVNVPDQQPVVAPVTSTLPVAPVSPEVDTAQPTSVAVSSETPKKRFPLMIMAAVLIILAAVAVVVYVFGSKLSTTKSISTPTPIALATPSSTPEPTAVWKTYNERNNSFSFKYPPGYKVEERISGFIVISMVDASTSGGLTDGINIDARTLGPYSSVSSAEASIRSSLKISETSKINTWQVFQGTGLEGMLKGVGFRQAIAPYKTGAIEAEVVLTGLYTDIFDQVLSTFEFQASPSATP